MDNRQTLWIAVVGDRDDVQLDTTIVATDIDELVTVGIRSRLACVNHCSQNVGVADPVLPSRPRYSDPHITIVSNKFDIVKHNRQGDALRQTTGCGSYRPAELSAAGKVWA